MDHCRGSYSALTNALWFKVDLFIATFSYNALRVDLDSIEDLHLIIIDTSRE